MRKTRRITSAAEWRAAHDALKRGVVECPLDQMQHRELSIRGVQPVDGDENVFEVSFSSETPVRRWFGREILGHGPDATVDLSPLLNVGSVLFNHDMDRPVAIPIEPRIDTSKRRGVARIRFVPGDEDSVEMKAKVLAGLVRGISVGYSVQKYLVDEETDDVTAVEWRVHEISLVTVPADASVGVGRSASGGSSNQAIPGGVQSPVNSGQRRTTAMFKLKDGREVSAAELENMRLYGDVELADGTVLKRAIPAVLVTEFVGARVAVNGGAKVVEVEQSKAGVPQARKAAPESTPDDDSELWDRSVQDIDKGFDRDERKRRHDIRQYVALGRTFAKERFPDGIESYYIMRSGEDGKPLSADAVRREIDAINGEVRSTQGRPANDGGTPSARGPISGGASREIESLVGSITQAVLIRSGVIDHGGNIKATGKPLAIRGAAEKLHDRSVSLSQLSLVDMAREFLEAHGHNCRGKSKRDILVMAMGNNGRSVANTASSFATLLENALNKTMLISYEAADTTWEQFCGTIPANDLRDHPLYKKGVFGNLARVGDSGEVPAGSYPDGKKEVLTPAEFARTFALTERVLINDDMNAFSSIISSMGSAAAYTVEDWVFYRLLANAVMTETGGALFNATAITTAGGHNNLTTGSGAPSDTTYQILETKMGKQVAPTGAGTGLGRVLNLRPAIALGPIEVGYTMRKLYSDTVKVGGTNGESNPVQGLARPVINARLATGVTVETEGGTTLSASGSATAWYLLADPRIMPTIVVAFLSGNDAPEFMEASPIDILGRVYRVALRFGVGVAEWRGAQKHAGA